MARLVNVGKVVDGWLMTGDALRAEGEELRQEIAAEREAAGRQRWKCSAELRTRVVSHAVRCRQEGESHERIAQRLGVAQPTLSHWVREAGQKETFRQVAIVPSEGRLVEAAAVTTLRLITPRGFVVEGLGAEELVALLRVLG